MMNLLKRKKTDTFVTGPLVRLVFIGGDGFKAALGILAKKVLMEREFHRCGQRSISG